MSRKIGWTGAALFRIGIPDHPPSRGPIDHIPNDQKDEEMDDDDDRYDIVLADHCRSENCRYIQKEAHSYLIVSQ